MNKKLTILILLCIFLCFTGQSQTHLASISTYTGTSGIELTNAKDVFIEGDYAYVISAASNSLEIINISNPTSPMHVTTVYDGGASNSGFFKMPGPTSVYVTEGKAYIGSTTSLEIIDVSNPSNPLHRGSITDSPTGAVINNPIVFAKNNVVYLANTKSSTFEIIVTNSSGANPIHWGKVPTNTNGSLLSSMSDVYVDGNYAYITSIGSNALEIIDVSQPNAPVYKGKLVHGTNGISLSQPCSVYVRSLLAYVVTRDNISIVDVSNPVSPQLVSLVSTSSYGYRSLAISGNYAFVGDPYYNNMRVYDISYSALPVQVGSIVDGSGGALLKSPNGIAVNGSYVYLASGGSNALEVINVSNPSIPLHAGSLVSQPFGPSLSNPLGVAVSGNYAFVADGSSNALEILDISVPTAPVHVAMLLDGAGGALLKQPKSIAIAGSYAYIVCWGSNNIEIVDISTPTLPIHKGKLVHGTGGALLTNPSSVYVSGNYAYVTTADYALEIINISNPSNPVHAGKLAHGTGGAALAGPSSVVVSGQYAYVTAQNNLEIINISNPSAPVHAGKILASSTVALSLPTSVSVQGNYAYVTSSGNDALEVINISDPSNPIHAGKIVTGSGGALLKYPSAVKVSGNYAYVTAQGNNNALEIINISNPSFPLHQANIVHGTNGALLNGPNALALQGNNIFVTSSTSKSLAIISYSVSTAILTQPSTSSQQVCIGGTFNPYFVIADGAGASLSYQWYRNITNSNIGGTLIDMATNSTYTPSSAVQGTNYYYVVVSGTAGTVTSSVSGAVTVWPPLSITSQPSTNNATYCLGLSANQMNVVATGIVTSHQWYVNTQATNSGGTSIYGATMPYYYPQTHTTGSYYYYVVISGPCGSITSSVTEMVEVKSLPTIVAQPNTNNQYVCLNSNPTPLSVSVSGAGNFTYQWYSSANSSNTSGTIVSGATSPTYIPSTTNAVENYYYAVVSGACGSTTSTISGKIEVGTPPSFLTHPSASIQYLCPGQIVATLTVNATSTSWFSYQWYSNSVNTNYGGIALSGETNFSFTPSSTSVGTIYYYVQASNFCGTTTSNVSGGVVITTAPIISSHPSTVSQTVCINGIVSPLSVIGSGTGLTYQWYSKTTSGNTGGTLISGAVNSSYTPVSTIADTKYYYAVITGSCGSTVSNASGAIIIKSETTITAHPSTINRTICLNSAPAYSLSVSASGTNVTYQWYRNTTQSNSGGTLISGATYSSYTPSTSISGTLYFYVKVTGQCGSTKTSNTSGEFTFGFLGASLSQSGNLCTGGVSLTAGVGSNYVWALLPGGVIPGSGNSITVFSSGNYFVNYQDPFGCAVNSSINVANCISGRVASNATIDSIPSDPQKKSRIQRVSKDVVISPNPANKRLEITLPTVSEKDMFVTIINTIGVTIQLGIIEKSNSGSSFDVSGLAEGMYVLKIYSSNLEYSNSKVLIIH